MIPPCAPHNGVELLDDGLRKRPSRGPIERDVGAHGAEITEDVVAWCPAGQAIGLAAAQWRNNVPSSHGTKNHPVNPYSTRNGVGSERVGFQSHCTVTITTVIETQAFVNSRRRQPRRSATAAEPRESHDQGANNAGCESQFEPTPRFSGKDDYDGFAPPLPIRSMSYVQY